MTKELEWYNVELSTKEFQVLRVLLKTNDIYFESSAFLKGVHVAIKCTQKDMETINYFIQKLVELQKRG